ncbi:FMN-dependent oxidoreductase, nitrilotriacetate monooxygenase family [Paenibacillus algorifonticola]|uniref:FMN-dependent oxidoreductase, nitrilotriacetate monooxygenase family n=1 Tax=Paenibacillus algorifonticola TaxID=684063 RepID=A0A1I2GQK4_9BACL|nr:LLM class flavin-dependent oxidoreductase [Paenibacillus algorifonticola]SFF18881.1 FMN-dependent oxidoreductase, nitrilotriacetate monooxygenase family [Paenibacillus algorifonticola]
MKKKIHLGVFEVNAVNHLTQGIWTHPEQNRIHYNSIDYWIDIARTLERGKFDFMFFADSYGYPKERTELAFREASGAVGNDPMLLIPALAQATEHLAFTMTTSTTYEAPYANARRFSTLDHITKGRIGWNVVTTSSKSAADLFGRSEFLPHDERYDMADEYMDVSYKYWEGSWQDDALLVDREKRIFADPQKVHKVKHEGKYFKSEGYHASTPSPQRTPVIFQAGSSGRGRAFAAKHAEGIFLKAPTTEVLRDQIADIRRRAAEYGRDPAAVKVFTGLSVVVAETREEAQRKFDEYMQHQSAEATLSSYAGVTGIDLTQLDPNAYFENIHTEMGQTHTDRFTKHSKTKKTVQEVMDDFVQKGFRGLTVVGTPEDVADQIERWTEETDVDGFNLEPYVLPGSYVDFVDLVIPELQKRGLFKTDYEAGTLRERLFGKGEARLPEHHPGASFRTPAALV